jgi:hypothetical protein
MYCSESSQALPVFPLVKIDRRKGRALRSEESKVGKWKDGSVQQRGDVEHLGGIFVCNCGVD